MFDKLTGAVLDHRAATAGLLALAFLAATAGLPSLRVDFSVEAFFGGDDPARRHLEAYQEYWGADDDVLMIVVDIPEGEGDLLTPRRMRMLDEVTDALAGAEHVERVDSITSVARLSGSEDTLDLSAVIEGMPDGTAESPAFRAWREQILAHPMAVPSLLSRDARVGALYVETEFRSDDLGQVGPLVAAIRAELERFEGLEGLRYGAAGIPAVRADFFDRFIADQTLYLPLGLAFIALVLALVFRRVHGVIIPATAAAVPVLMVFGIMGWTGQPLGLVNQVYTTLLPVIAIADAIHLLTRFHEEARQLARPGQRLTSEQRRTAIVATMRHIGTACLLTSVTTALGFASLMAAHMPSLRSFGLYAAIGIMLAYGTVLLLLPLMLSTVRGAEAEPKAGWIDRALAASAGFAVQHPARVLTATAVVLVASIAFGSRVVADNHLTQMLLPEHPTTQANLRADAALGGILAIEVDLLGDTDALRTPAVLEALLQIEHEVEGWEQVKDVASPARYVAVTNEIITGAREIPSSRAGVAQLYLLGEGDEALDRMLALDGARGRMMIRTQDHGGIVFGDLSARVRKLLDERLEGVPLEAHITGTPFIAYRGINAVTADLRNSLLVAFLTIGAVIALLLRDLRVAALCLIPNALPLLAGYGLIGATGWLLDPGGAVIFTIALGIAVDDTLHLIARTHEELERGHDLETAIRRSVSLSGRAVAITTVLLMGGFGMNLMSSFPSTVLVGAVGTSIIATALISDVLVLPALLSAFAGRTRWATASRPAQDAKAASASV